MRSGPGSPIPTGCNDGLRSCPTARSTVSAPHDLVHQWGPDVLRWRLTPTATGCQLTLEQTMADRTHAAENAGGWHICLDVLADNLDGAMRERLVGEVVMEHGFPELRDGYRKVLGV
jgi:hypothetical protein